MAQKPIAPELMVFAVAAMFAAHKVAELPAPTIHDVHKRVRVSMSTAYNMIKYLERVGVIDPMRRPGGARAYTNPRSMHPAAIRMREWRENNREQTSRQEKRASKIRLEARQKFKTNATREERLLTMIRSQSQDARRNRSTDNEQRDQRKASSDKRIVTPRA